MNYYELLMMARNATTEGQVDDMEKLLKSVVETREGSLVKFDRWGKLKLAFPIEYKDYAYFVLARFKLPNNKVSGMPKDIDNLLKIKLNSVVIRYVMLNLSEETFNAPYKKPEAFIPVGPANGKGGFASRKPGFGSSRKEDDYIGADSEDEATAS